MFAFLLEEVSLSLAEHLAQGTITIPEKPHMFVFNTEDGTFEFVEQEEFFGAHENLAGSGITLWRPV